VGGALGAQRYTLLLFIVTFCLSLLMVSNVRFRSFKDLKLNTGSILLVLFTLGSSAFVWQRFKPQFVLVWLLSVYIFIGIVESIRVLMAHLSGRAERSSVPPT
jgi:CDP-diacylglycerol--serine O-phosphatidyltransferase